MKLEVPVDLFTTDERLLDPERDARPTELCQRLSRGEALAAEFFIERRIIEGYRSA